MTTYDRIERGTEAETARRSAIALRCTLSFTLLFGTAVFAQGPGGPGGPGGRPGMPGSPGGPGGPGGAGMGRPAGPPASGGNVPTGAAPGARLAGPASRWWDEGKYAKSVGLTNDQQRRMDSVFQENRNALVSGLDSLRKAQARLDALSATEHPSESAVLSEIQNVAQARADLAKTSAHMQLQIRNEMTNDQLNKLDKLK